MKVKRKTKWGELQSENNYKVKRINEDNIPRQESIRPRLLESDLNLLGNPKKTKKLT